jgi:hypothetical protein
MRKTNVYISVSISEELIDFLGREGRQPTQQLSLDLELLRRLLQQESGTGKTSLARALKKARQAAEKEQIAPSR